MAATPIVVDAAPRVGHRRGIAVAAALVLLLHAGVIGEIGRVVAPGPGRPPPPAALATRSIEAPVEVQASAAPEVAAVSPAPATPPPERPAVRAPAPTVAASAVASADRAASTPVEASAAMAGASAPSTVSAAAAAAAPASAVEGDGTAAGAGPATVVAARAVAPAADIAEEVSASLQIEGSAASMLLEGGRPPPTFRVALPPAVTLRYQVRRGFLRGDGEIRWLPSADGYVLRLEARIGGLTLLTQSSEGAIGSAGLAPRRFVDQRVRRPAQAANFDADAGRIRFSGPAITYPLLAGTQDRLSLYLQLAGIAAADPGRMVEGALLPIVVVGARGDAVLWTLRVAGREGVDTAGGTVQAVKLVREARRPGDSSAEIWLDPDRHWLPVHATLRNSQGASEYDLLLEGIVSGP